MYETEFTFQNKEAEHLLHSNVNCNYTNVLLQLYTLSLHQIIQSIKTLCYNQ